MPDVILNRAAGYCVQRLFRDQVSFHEADVELSLANADAYVDAALHHYYSHLAAGDRAATRRLLLIEVVRILGVSTRAFSRLLAE